MILFEETYEREGNDSWLTDHVQLQQNSFGLYLEHKQRWTGWQGELNEDNTLHLDASDIEASQKKIDEFIKQNSLFRKLHNGSEEGIKINLSELLKK